MAFPLLRQDLAGRGPSWEGRRHIGPKGVTSPGSCLEASVWGVCSLSSFLPSRLQRRGRLPWCLSPCLLFGLESRRPVPKGQEAATWNGG